MVKRYIGLLIVTIGALLALAALIGVTFRGAELLATFNAPIFEQALRALLINNAALYKIATFAFTIIILIASLIGFSRQGSHIGFVIMFSALLNGFLGWPHVTPFMLIVLMGAHWITVSEYASHPAQAGGGGHKPVPAPEPAPTPKDSAAADKDSPPPPAEDSPAEQETGANEGGKKQSPIKRMFTSFFR